MPVSVEELQQQVAQLKAQVAALIKAAKAAGWSLS